MKKNVSILQTIFLYSVNAVKIILKILRYLASIEKWYASIKVSFRAAENCFSLRTLTSGHFK